MQAHDENKLIQLNDHIKGRLILTLIESEHNISDGLKAFCDNLSSVVPKVKIIREYEEDGGLPGIQLRNGITFHLIPQDSKLDPFIEALLPAEDPLRDLPDGIRSMVSHIKLPAHLQVFIAPQCRFCPAVVRSLTRVAAATELVYLTIIDGTLFPGLTRQLKIKAVPTILLDERFRWTGSVPLRELLDVMIHRDAGSLSPAVMERLVSEGNAVKLAEMMLDAGKIFPSLINLLTHDAMSIRLGAMVAVEVIDEKNHDLAMQVVGPLRKNLAGLTDSVKGDVIYLFGELEAENTISDVKKILAESNAGEVKEAASEALEKLHKA